MSISKLVAGLLMAAMVITIFAWQPAWSADVCVKVCGPDISGTVPTPTPPPDGAPVCTLTASPTQITVGEATHLTMICVPYAVTYDLVSGQTCDQVLGCPWFKPTVTTTYQMVGVGSTGLRSAVQAVTVSVAPPSACGPGETFGNADLVWSPFISSRVFPSQPVVAAGDRGLAIRFVADAAQFPDGIKLNVFDQSGSAPAKDAVISACPHSFTPLDNIAGCAKAGVGNVASFYLKFGGTANALFECGLTAGGTYYLNFRDSITPRGSVSSQFYFLMR